MNVFCCAKRRHVEPDIESADKSEALNKPELHAADQKIEYLRTIITQINKKIIPSNGQPIDIEKHMKKCYEYQIGAAFSEEKTQEHLCHLLNGILKEAGKVEKELAREYAEHEKKVEEMVYSPLQKLIDNDFPNIMKQKRALSKYCLDKDSANNRYNATKKENLRDNVDEADNKVEQSRDALAIEMFTLLSRENEISTHILQFLKLQRAYHEGALESLKRIIPKLEQEISDSPVKKIFGTPLEEHLRVTGKKIALPLEICIPILKKIGLGEEGIFRIVGGMSRVKRFKAAMESGCLSSTLITEYQDIHVVASTLKMYLRELPEPLLTFSLLKDWTSAMSIPEQKDQRLCAVKNILLKLPQANRDNLTYLMQFLVELQKHPENKMTTSSLAIVLAPNLLWYPKVEDNMNMSNCGTINTLLEFFLREAEVLFMDNISKYVNSPAFENWEEKNIYTRSSTNDLHHSNNADSSSPRPSNRKKKAAPSAPISKTDQDISSVRLANTGGSNYESGSSTLNRPKSKDTPKMNSVGINVRENNCTVDGNLSQENVISAHNHTDDINVRYLVKTEEIIKNNKVESDTDTSKTSKLVEHAEEGDKKFTTTAVYQVNNHVDPDPSFNHKPVAAPRTILANESERIVSLSRNSSTKSNMSKSLTAVENDFTLRKVDGGKPEIPTRPASLQKRPSIDNITDPTLQKTHCSVHNVASKQQPSIVNIQNINEKYQPGHDSQMAEKEKFLLNSEKATPKPRLSLENKNNDINSNNNLSSEKMRHSCPVNKPELPPKGQLGRSNDKLDISKSNEKIDDCSERINGNERTGHIRTRSDGNIVDIGNSAHPTSLLQTPPSPRSLNKPSQPPPPPPNMVKAADSSTDL